jgi:hypothetical protein
MDDEVGVGCCCRRQQRKLASAQAGRQACSGFMCQYNDDDDVVVAVFGERWFGETLESRNLRRCNGSQILFTLLLPPLLGNNPQMSVQSLEGPFCHFVLFFLTPFQHITKLPSGSSSSGLFLL